MKRGKSLKACIDCKRLFHKKDISKNGRCKECARKAFIGSIRDLRQKEGHYYEKWKKGMKKLAKEL